MLLDGLVRGLAPGAGFDGLHEHGGGEQEGQVAQQLALDDGVEDFHLIQNGEQGLQQAVHGEEGIRQHDAADDGAGDIALVPLVAGEAGGHGEVAFEDDVEAVHALAGAVVHFVRHGGAADLAFGETLAGQLVPGHEAQGAGEAGGAGGELAEGGDDLEIQAARIDLAGGVERGGDAEVAEDAGFEFAGLGGVAIKKGDLVEPGADGAFEAARRVGADEVLQGLHAEEQLLPKHGPAAAEGGDLGGDVVRARGEGDVPRLDGAAGEGGEGGEAFFPHFQQGAEDLELLDIFGEVAAGHAFVDVLVPGQLAEFLDARLHIVAGDALALHDGGEKDLVLHGLVSLDDAFRHGDAELALAFEHGDPVVALQADLALGGPEGAHGGGGVAFGEDIGDGVNHGAGMVGAGRR